jgi:hypothetical protein
MADLLRLGVGIGVLLAGAGIFYNHPQDRQESPGRLAQEQPQIAQEPRQQQVEKLRAQVAELAACLAQAEADLIADLNKPCSTSEAKRSAELFNGFWTGPGCPLPKAMAARVWQSTIAEITAEKEDCYKKQSLQTQ